jgi:hypothetical protein
MSFDLDRVTPTYQLQPLDLVAPGFRGINTVQAGSLLDPAYCITASNAVIDTAGRLSARQGVTSSIGTTTATFTVPPTGTGGNLTAVWAPASGTYATTFSDGETRAAVYTNGSIAVTWLSALTGAPTVTASVTFAVITRRAFTAPPSGSAGTLTAAFTPISGTYPLTFSTGQVVQATFTQGSTAVTFLTPVTGTPTVNAYVTMPILTIFEYAQGAGVYSSVLAWSGGISNNFANPTANNIAGAVTVTNGQWFFQNFNNKVVGFQAGLKPIVATGAGNFATVTESSGTAPTGGVGCAAFGRVWATRTDGQTIQYTGLLDETDWGSASSGLIDMRTIWSAGTDTVTAIMAFNASLVVFGTNHIVFFTDGRGSMLGLDPTQAYVFDVILSTGCYSQWTTQPIGEGDVVFLGPNGMQSIANLQNSRSFPMSNLTKYVRDNLLAQLASETIATVRTTYNNQLGQVFLSFPNSQTVWCIDVRRKYQDDIGDTCGICTNWAMVATAMETTHLNVTQLARTPGTTALYSGNTDEGSPYTFTYLSGWLNLGIDVAQKLKMLKRIEGIIFSGGTQQFVYSWNTDFAQFAQTATQIIPATGAVSQYGLGQYGVSQYGGGSSLSIIKYDARARGQYYQVGVSAVVVNLFSIQQLQLAVKIGRIA